VIRALLRLPLAAPAVLMAAALTVPAAAATPLAFRFSPRQATLQAQAPGPGSAAPARAPGDPFQTTYLRECMGAGAAAAQRRAYCQCSYQQLRRRYTPQQYALLDGWIRSGPQELRRFAVVAWEPEFASCRPLLQGGSAAPAPQQGRQPAGQP
jgi:hypothetical protein